MITFVISAILAIRIVNYLRKGGDASFFAAFCEVLIDGFLVVMTFLAAIFITVGFKTWCSEMTRR